MKHGWRNRDDNTTDFSGGGGVVGKDKDRFISEDFYHNTTVSDKQNIYLGIGSWIDRKTSACRWVVGGGWTENKR